MSRTARSLDLTFRALADPTRRAMLALLSKRDRTVMELARPFKISQPSISRHLRVLEEAGLIETSVRGSERPRRLRTAQLAAASEWLDRHREEWEERFRKLDGLLEELKQAEKGKRG